MERADQVLAVACVDPGLAADRAVDLRQQRGRDLHIGDAAQQGRGAEPSEVADHAAAERDDRGRALDPAIEHGIEQGLELGQALGGLARRHDDPPMTQPGRIEARLEPAKMRGRGEVGVGDDDQIAACHRGQLLAALRQEARADHDVVAALRQIDPHPGSVAHEPAPPAPVSACRARATTSPIGPLPLSTIKSASA